MLIWIGRRFLDYTQLKSKNLKILHGIDLSVEEKEEFELTIERQKLVLKSFGNIAKLRKYLEKLKDLSLDVKLVEEDFDDRLKLDDYKRVIVKLYDLIYRYRAIGKIFHKSSKWIKQIVEDPDLERIIEQADKCPQCSFEWAPFFRIQAKKIEKGLEPKLPPKFAVEWESWATGRK